MNAAPLAASGAPQIGPQPWSPRRVAVLAALLFALHLALILALGQRGRVQPRPPAPAPLLRIEPSHSELLALSDPTLFALPHPDGFAGRAWLRPAAPSAPPRPLAEPPRWLAPTPDSLGTTFQELARAHRPAPVELCVNPIPEPLPEPQREPAPTPPSRSALVLADGLEARRLLTPIQLPAWPAADLLTNTLVRVLINGDGLVRSATLWGRSGSVEADEFALGVARAAQFEPLRAPPGAGSVQLGTMIFCWSTLPLTNAPAPAP